MIFIWLIIWMVGIVFATITYDAAVLTTFGLIIFPFIVCAFLVPLFLFYERSNISFNLIKKTVFKYNPDRPKIIAGLCYLYIPISIIAILSLILFPNSFKNYGPKFNATYSYMSAIIFSMQLLSLIGYWHMKKWGVYLYILSSFLGLIIFFSYFEIPPNALSILGHLLIIAIDYKYILKKAKHNKRLKLT